MTYFISLFANVSFLTWFCFFIFFAFATMLVITFLEKKKVFDQDEYYNKQTADFNRAMYFFVSLIWPITLPIGLIFLVICGIFFGIFQATKLLADKLVKKLDQKSK